MECAVHRDRALSHATILILENKSRQLGFLQNVMIASDLEERFKNRPGFLSLSTTDILGWMIFFG